MRAPLTRLLGGLLLSAALSAAGCSVDTTGAACAANDNCPDGQSCVAGKCQEGSGTTTTTGSTSSTTGSTSTSTSSGSSDTSSSTGSSGTSASTSSSGSSGSSGTTGPTCSPISTVAVGSPCDSSGATVCLPFSDGGSGVLSCDPQDGGCFAWGVQTACGPFTCASAPSARCDCPAVTGDGLRGGPARRRPARRRRGHPHRREGACGLPLQHPHRGAGGPEHGPVGHGLQPRGPLEGPDGLRGGRPGHGPGQLRRPRLPRQGDLQRRPQRAHRARLAHHGGHGGRRQQLQHHLGAHRRRGRFRVRAWAHHCPGRRHAAQQRVSDGHLRQHLPPGHQLQRGRAEGGRGRDHQGHQPGGGRAGQHVWHPVQQRHADAGARGPAGLLRCGQPLAADRRRPADQRELLGGGHGGLLGALAQRAAGQQQRQQQVHPLVLWLQLAQSFPTTRARGSSRARWTSRSRPSSATAPTASWSPSRGRSPRQW